MVQFLHVADLHLGMRVTRFSADSSRKIREARFQALEKILKLANAPGAGFDFVVVAGDLFDDGAVDAHTARRAFDMFETFQPPVLVLPGNHDPLQAGSLWDHDPWRRTDTRRVRVLRTREPVDAGGATIFPCPVFRRTSTENPTEWIRGFPARSGRDQIRIGIAHGSVMDRPHLPEDDHPIRPDAPGELQLDYMALGHWHSHLVFKSDGQPRMVYPGVHEPMRFNEDAQSLGWRPYSSGGMRPEFLDGGCGTAVAVRIDGPGTAPQLQNHAVGHLNWSVRKAVLHTDDDLSNLIAHVANLATPELTVFKLLVDGVLPARAMFRLQELRDILGRFLVHELDDQLVLEPDEREVAEVVGSGVLGTVHQAVRGQLLEGSESERARAGRALRLLFRLAQQVRERAT